MLYHSKNMRLSYTWTVTLLTLATSCLLPTTTQALPFTYEFTSDLSGPLTANPDPSLFGTALNIEITFDNGNLTNVNQVFSFGDIVNASVSSVGGTFSIPGSDPKTISFTGNPADLYATTDSGGSIILPPPFSNNIVVANSTTVTSILDGDEIVFAAWWFSGRHQRSKAADSDEALGPLAAIPEPPTWALLLAGLAGLGLAWRRKMTPVSR